MIDAEINGITPNANIENVFKLPPLIRFKSSKNPKSLVIALAPGTTILVPNPKIARIAKVNKILFLKLW